MFTIRSILKLVSVAALAIVPLGAALAATPPPAAAQAAAPEASIPFVRFGGINDWQADHNRGLWVQDLHRHWYYAKFMGPCEGLSFTNAIGFDAQPTDTFDRFSAVIVPGWGRCQLSSFTVSEAPAAKQTAKQTAKPLADKSAS